MEIDSRQRLSLTKEQKAEELIVYFYDENLKRYILPGPAAIERTCFELGIKTNPGDFWRGL